MGNVLSATFKSQALKSGLLQKVTVKQQFGSHVLVLLDYRTTHKTQYVMPSDRTPMTAHWGTSPVGVRYFHGYVNHYETTNAGNASSTRVYCLGTSMKMNATNPTAWVETSRSSMARDLAKRHRLRSIINPHPAVVESWMSGPRSDWQVLQTLAKEAGYLVWVDGSTMFFIDPDNVLTTAASRTSVRYASNQIKKFEILAGHNIPGLIEPTRRDRVYGLDTANGEVFSAASGSTAYPENLIPQNVSTYTDARNVVESASRRQRNYYAAKAVLNGNAFVYPGSLVNLDSDAISRDQGGMWLVAETEHVVTPSAFTTTATLVRDRNLLSTPSRSAARQVLPFTDVVLRDGVNWEATVQEHINV